MSEGLILVFAAFSLLYGFFVVILWVGWKTLPVFRPQPVEQFCSLSVLVAVRNESANLLLVLKDLENQNFDKKYFEVIIIDDHSTDETAAIAAGFCGALNLRLLCLPPGREGKKAALTFGLESARGELIVTTDGDCRVPATWLNTLHNFYQLKKPQFISAPVCFDFQQSFFEKLQTVEFASLIVTGAACMHLGMPNMCNGANLAYTREAFREVGGFSGTEAVASGDDEFLMQKIRSRYPGKVAFLKSRQALVRTRAQKTLSLFINQRRRWAGKWKMHKDWKVQAVAIFIFTYHLLFLLALVLMLTQLQPPTPVGWLCFSVRLTTEFLLLSPVLHFFGKTRYVVLIPAVQLFYSLYAIFTGIVANFGGYKWKERKWR